MAKDDKAGKKRFEDFISWFEEQGAECVGGINEGVGGDGYRYGLYRYRARMVIVVEYPRGHGFDVYVPVTDQNSVEAVKQGLLALSDPAEEQKLKQRVAAMLGRLEGLGWKDGALDDCVHDVKGEEAAGINNDGPSNQVEYLFRAGCTEDDILDGLKEGDDGQETPNDR